MHSWTGLSGWLRSGFCLALAAVFVLFLAWPTIAAADGVEYITLFSDDFESGQATAWLARGPVEGQWSVQEKFGFHFLDIQGRITLSPSGGGTTWTDYVLRVKTALLDGEAAINLRAQGPGPGAGSPTDWYQLLLSHYDLRLYKVHSVQGSKAQPTLLTSATVEFRPDTWYAVSIELAGNQIAVSVDGVPKLKYVDERDPLLYGAFNLSSTGLSTSHVQFDDVWVGRVKAPVATPLPMVAPVQPAVPTSSPAPTPGSLTPQRQATLEPTPTQGALPRSLLGMSFSLETIAAIVAIVTGVGSIGGWLISRNVAGGKKRRLRRLLDEIDGVYAHFKMNSRRCEAELYRLRDIIVEQLKEGRIEEPTFTILEKRLDSYLREVQERIIDEKLGGFPSRLKNSLSRMLNDGVISEQEFSTIEKVLMATSELSEEDKAELRESLALWRTSYVKEEKANQGEG